MCDRSILHALGLQLAHDEHCPGVKFPRSFLGDATPAGRVIRAAVTFVDAVPSRTVEPPFSEKPLLEQLLIHGGIQ